MLQSMGSHRVRHGLSNYTELNWTTLLPHRVIEKKEGLIGFHV